LSKLSEKLTSEQSDKYVQQLDSIEQKQHLIRCRLRNGLHQPFLYIESEIYSSLVFTTDL